MKRTIPALILAGLILAAMTSCKKDDDDKGTGTTTSTTSTTGTNTNPLIKKAGRGTADIIIDGQADTIMAMEGLFPPLNLYGIYTNAEDFDVTLQSGANALPAKNTTFTVAGDPDKMPDKTEMILSFYDSEAEKDYYAQNGTISYTITATAKIVKFSNIVFKAQSGETKTISFEVALK